MECKVQGVYKNIRYSVLSVGEQRYILDMGGWSFWKLLFPFAYWIFPNTVYKIDDHKLVGRITSPEVKSDSSSGDVLLVSGIGITLPNLLYPLVKYFDIESTPYINTIIVATVLFIIVAVFFYIDIRSQKSLLRKIDLHQYEKKQMCIRPCSIKHFSFILFNYFFFLGLTIVGWMAFIDLSNGFMLFFGVFFFFILIIIDYTVFGTKARLKDYKKPIE